MQQHPDRGKHIPSCHGPVSQVRYILSSFPPCTNGMGGIRRKFFEHLCCLHQDWCERIWSFAGFNFNANCPRKSTKTEQRQSSAVLENSSTHKRWHSLMRADLTPPWGLLDQDALVLFGDLSKSICVRLSELRFAIIAKLILGPKSSDSLFIAYLECWLCFHHSEIAPPYAHGILKSIIDSRVMDAEYILSRAQLKFIDKMKYDAK